MFRRFCGTLSHPPAPKAAARIAEHPHAVCRSVWLRRALKMRVAYINNAHDLELWYFQILADLFGKSIYNLDIARNSRCLHVRWIVEDSVLPTLSKKLAPMLLQMAKQYPSLHQTATLIFSQTNSLPVNPFSASSLLETKINSIASRRFSRVSSRVLP